MEDNRVLKLIYTVFVGVLIAIVIGVGINTFYPPAPGPKYPVELETQKEPTEEGRAIERAYQAQEEAYREEMKPYNRNVSVMTLIAAVALMGLSILLRKRIKFLADGVMLGGLFTLFYSLGRGFASEDSKYVFIAAIIGLIVTVYLGYSRFVVTQKKD